MAEQGNATPRFTFFPIILGMIGPTVEEPSERVVMLNPFTRSMVVLGHAMDGSVSGGPPPASKESIEALKVVKKEENEKAECPVCLEKLFEKEKEEVVVKEMPCGHRYHGKCISKWLHMHGSCPMCRYKMPEEKYEGKKREEEREEGGNGVWVSFSFEARSGGAESERRSESD